MTYYRLAMQNQQTALWTWKSTVVTSLQALFQLLRIYQALPQDRLRVFSSAWKEELTLALLDSEKSLTVCSVTAAEFAHARQLQTRGTAGSGSHRGAGESAVQPSTAVTAFSWQVHGLAASLVAVNSLNNLEKQRLETEMGPGGDHDLPYIFVLPPSFKEVLAWMRLLAQVQSGEVQP